LSAHLVSDVGWPACTPGGHLDTLLQARVVIAVAGMEGACPASWRRVKAPVIAVPTSTGYGPTSPADPAPGHVNSCAPGVGVVNIDNGFGAAVLGEENFGQNG
jgi:NCAIR mutase (PurE)-related protein